DSRCYVVRFEPGAARRGLAKGRAWIDTKEFTLRRLETVQRDLHGAIVSSEQVDEFGPVPVDGTTVWLPIQTKIFQSYEGAGFRTPIHRTLTVRHYVVNSPAFAARLAAARDVRRAPVSRQKGNRGAFHCGTRQSDCPQFDRRRPRRSEHFTATLVR